MVFNVFLKTPQMFEIQKKFDGYFLKNLFPLFFQKGFKKLTKVLVL